MLNFLECRDLGVKILNFLEGQLFANLCTALSAIGTIGAVIVALIFSYRENRVKYIIQPNKYAKPLYHIRKYAYAISIHNISLNRTIMLTEYFYVKCSPPKKLIPFKLEKRGLQEKYILPHNIVPGETFIFLIRINQIEQILKEVKTEKILIYFIDKLNKKYKINIKKSDLEKFVATDWNNILGNF